ncbi:hypothetical protein [Phenylobacterium aquaticum]|uniref:hypothetical protein n=1 Tax=Phenylobacterium aquaticum TaxID=1763816 RepID=UPI0026EBD93C|nr:hypothetical protein [Phenylobacterium aquaticum]
MAAPLPAPESSPARLGDLLRGEHTLIWAFRALAFGAGGCPLLKRQFADCCGPIGTETLNALTVFVRELGLHGRRKVTLCAPGSYALSCDERLLLALFGAAQAEDYARMEAHLAWLLADAPRPPFGAAACLVAQAFGMNDLTLRVPAWVEAEADPSLAFGDGVVIPFPLRASA